MSIELGTHDELMAKGEEDAIERCSSLQAQRFGGQDAEEGVTYDVLA